MDSFSNSTRVAALDVLRGLVMVIMALDHVRDFTNRGAMLGAPTDLATTTAAVFMTRWVTHICAPAFALAAGLGAWFWTHRNQDLPGLAHFLVTRGLWLALIEITLMQLLYYFSWPGEVPFLLLVLWSLGLSMVVLAGLARLPRRLLLTGAAAAMLLNPALGAIVPAGSPLLDTLMTILSRGGVLRLGDTSVAVPYPVLPWAGVMAFGYLLGPVVQSRGAGKRLQMVGVILISAFVLLRLWNGYGDPSPWSTQGSPFWSAMSFLNVSKYPASPSFLFMTVGVALLSLGTFERAGASLPLAGPLATLGRVPLFFYLLHFLLAHLFATAVWFMRYGSAASDFVLLPYPSLGGRAAAFPADFGLPLWGTYCIWMAVLAAAYPACRWYGALKQRRDRWWIRYL